MRGFTSSNHFLRSGGFRARRRRGRGSLGRLGRRVRLLILQTPVLIGFSNVTVWRGVLSISSPGVIICRAVGILVKVAPITEEAVSHNKAAIERRRTYWSSKNLYLSCWI